MFNKKAQEGGEESSSPFGSIGGLLLVLAFLIIIAAFAVPAIIKNYQTNGQLATLCNETYKGTCAPSEQKCGADQVPQFPKLDGMCGKDNPSAICCVPRS